MAGFEVTGVDIAPQKHYPFAFIEGDALEYIEQHGHEYDVIHASPPCQAYSIAARGTGKTYPDLLAQTRELLIQAGNPWIIENVPGAPMRADYRLCGCQFDLRLRRQRWFETSWHGFSLMRPCEHFGPVPSVVGHGTPTWVRQALGYNPTIAEYRECMGIGWMNRDELSQAIPPAYTKWIGERLLSHLEAS
jgi:DNA (cytosine-5)-methyltransferase 1